jgi:hypothetical protein
MSFTTACPNCDARLQAPDTVEGKRVKCKKCGEAFVARPLDDEGDDRPARGSARPEARSRRPVRDDDEERPRRSSARAARPANDEEDDDRPRRRREEDEDADEPRAKKKRKKKKAAGPPVLLFVLIGVAALVLIGGAVGAFLYFSDDKTKDNPVAKTGPGAGGPGGPGPGAALTAGWVDHHDPNGRYRVRFPTAPRSQSVTNQTPAGPVSVTMFMSGGQSEVFVSGQQPVPADRMGLSDEQLLEQGMGMARAQGKGAAIGDVRPINYQGFAGRELVINPPGKKGALIMRLILAKDRLVFLMAGGDGATADTPRVKAFFESLKIE